MRVASMRKTKRFSDLATTIIYGCHIAFVAAVPFLSAPLQAQQAAPPSMNALLPAIAGALSPIVLDPTRKEVLETITPAIALASRATPPTEIAPFERVPNDLTPYFSSGGDSLLDRLQALDEDIELSTPPLTDEQKTLLVKARNLLYVDGVPPQPSQPYAKYLDFEKKAKTLSDAFAAATNVADRTNAQVELQTLIQDWEAFGQRLPISQALYIMSKYGIDQARDLRSSWQRTLSAAQVGDYSGIWDALLSTTEWSSVTVPVPAQQMSVRAYAYPPANSSAPSSRPSTAGSVGVRKK